MLKLYHGRTSVCSVKARLTLAEKGQSFESQLLTLRGDQFDPAYMKLNPNVENDRERPSRGVGAFYSPITTDFAEPERQALAASLTRNPGDRQSAWSTDSRPGPQAMMASAIAAHVKWIGQPSGTVSSTMQVMNRRPNAAKRVPKPSTRSTGKMISPQPERKAITAGAGKS